MEEAKLKTEAENAMKTVNEKPKHENCSTPLFAIFPKLHLQSLKVLLDFISCSKDLMENEELKSRLQDRMVNVVNIFIQIEEKCLDGLQIKNRASAKWQQDTALDCDWSMVLFPLLQQVHEHLEFTPGKRLSDKESGIVCIQRFISFGLLLAQETGRYVWNSQDKQLKPA
jgi:hypothetical protein